MDNLTQCDDRVPRRQGQPLSTSMQKKVLGVLRQMFGKAYRQRLITFDPAAAAEIHFTRPDRDTQALTAWTEEEANRLYAVARSHHIGVAFCFALSTGMRIGEVLGLRLEHVDLKSGEVQISESLLSYRGHRLVTTPKTQHSTRTIYVTSDALAILREHKQRKSAARDAYPSRYEETDYVFTNQFGRSILPCTVYAVMARLCAQAGVPYRGTHVQRRTYTSLQAQAGVGMDVISKQLGHSDPAFTARVYRTVFNAERKALTLDFSRPGKKKA